MFEVSGFSFFSQLDVTTMQQVKEAAEEGCVLRYVGIVDVENGKSEVALRR